MPKMDELETILGHFMSGSGRLAAAGCLFLTVFVIERVPVAKDWLSKDSGPLTVKLKKFLANVVLAMVPAAVLLAKGAPGEEVIKTAILAAAGASLLNAQYNALRPKDG